MAHPLPMNSTFTRIETRIETGLTGHGLPAVSPRHPTAVASFGGGSFFRGLRAVWRCWFTYPPAAVLQHWQASVAGFLNF